MLKALTDSHRSISASVCPQTDHRFSDLQRGWNQTLILRWNKTVTPLLKCCLWQCNIIHLWSTWMGLSLIVFPCALRAWETTSCTDERCRVMSHRPGQSGDDKALFKCVIFNTERTEFKGALIVPQDRLFWHQNTALLFALTYDQLGKWWLRRLFLISGKFRESCFSVPNWCEVQHITQYKTALHQIFYSDLYRV